MFGADPVLQLFTWLSGTAAVGVILLMAGTSAAVVGFFRTRPGGGSVWQRAIAPTLATIALVALVVLLIGNFDALLGTDPASPLRWILPGLVLLAGVVGAIWAVRLRSTRPDALRRDRHHGRHRSTTTTSRSCSTCPARSTSCGGSCSQTPGPGRGGQVSGVSRPRA